MASKDWLLPSRPIVSEMNLSRHEDNGDVYLLTRC